MNDTMTVKELAEVAGVNPVTVRRAIKAKLGLNMRSGVETTLDAEQCILVISALKIKGDRSVQKRQNVVLKEQNVQPEIVKAFTEALQVMNKMAEACLAMSAKLQAAPVIAPPEQEYSTVSGYCRRNGIRVDPETAKRFGKIASAISTERGYPIRKISDERWGEVNAYHVSILAQAVAV